MYALLLIDKKGFEKRIGWSCLPPMFECPVPEGYREHLDLEAYSSFMAPYITFYKTKETTPDGCYIYREKP